MNNRDAQWDAIQGGIIIVVMLIAVVVIQLFAHYAETRDLQRRVGQIESRQK